MLISRLWTKGKWQHGLTISSAFLILRCSSYFLKGNNALAKVFIGLLYNGAPKPLLEKTSNGRLKVVQVPRFTPPTIIKEKE